MTAYDRKELDREARRLVRDANKAYRHPADRVVYRGWRILIDGANTCLQAYANAPNGALVPFNMAI